MKKKMNNKGFMMAEVVVMAAIILGVLTSIYTSYSKVFARYSTVLNYYNVDGIYTLAAYRDNMIGNGNLQVYLNSVNEHGYIKFADNHENYPGLCIVKKDNINNLLTDASAASSSFNQAYKEYIEYIYKSVSFKNNYVMLLEYDCFDDAKKSCYSYLELED